MTDAASRDRFVQPFEWIRKVPPKESFRDLPPEKREERMRVMYRNVKPERQPEEREAQ